MRALSLAVVALVMVGCKGPSTDDNPTSTMIRVCRDGERVYRWSDGKFTLNDGLGGTAIDPAAINDVCPR